VDTCVQSAPVEFRHNDVGPEQKGPVFMFLAYADDSGTADTSKPFQLMTVILVPGDAFRYAEVLNAVYLGGLIPQDKAEIFWQKFTEFKAYELFNGYGPFEGIEQDVRFKIIELLLETVNTFEFPIVYGAVNKAAFKEKCFAYGSANLLDVCFRLCIHGVHECVSKRWPDQLALLIADETDGKTKSNLRATFYEYRQRVRPKSARKSRDCHICMMIFILATHVIQLGFSLQTCVDISSQNIWKETLRERDFTSLLRSELSIPRLIHNKLSN